MMNPEQCKFVEEMLTHRNKMTPTRLLHLAGEFPKYTEFKMHARRIQKLQKDLAQAKEQAFMVVHELQSNSRYND